MSAVEIFLGLDYFKINIIVANENKDSFESFCNSDWFVYPLLLDLLNQIKIVATSKRVSFDFRDAQRAGMWYSYFLTFVYNCSNAKH